MAGRALVTGLAGFPGRSMARELEELGYEVVGLGQGPAGSGANLAVDLRDVERLMDTVTAIQPRVVVHLAAVAFVAHGDVSDIYTSNIVKTVNCNNFNHFAIFSHSH